MKRLLIIIMYTFILLGSFASQAFAHRLQPAYLEISEQTTGKFNILWKRPLVGNRPMNIYPHLPETCSNITEPSINPSQGFALERWLIDCGESGLANGTIVIDGLEKTVTDTLVRIYYAEGAEETHLLRPATNSAVVGGNPSGLKRIVAYLQLGIQHILMGIDHLLFVLGLLLIVKSRWMLLKTITSFTVAHSITVVAFAFGLLHGFGFATGLTNLGLRTAEIPQALLLFNLGVEFGQVAFVMLVILLERSFRALEIHWPRLVQMAPGYTVGSLGAFWTIQRTVILIRGLL
jgi:multisubunit Na+/H+ antiporter MnhC subunit